MSYIRKPQIIHRGLARNDLGLTVRDYEGGMSTLCAGCGHDSVTGALVQAAFELSIPTPDGEAERHWLLVEDAGVFPAAVARFQLRARSHAVGGHRGQRGER